MTDQKPTPVPGDHEAAAREGARGASGRTGGGESGGGAYPNPHAAGEGKSQGFLGHGGQSDIAYHGPGQLGEDKVGDDADDEGGAPNSATREG